MRNKKVENYGNLRIIRIINVDRGKFNYGDISAFSYGDIIVRYHDGNLDIQPFRLKYKRSFKHFIKALSYIYGDIKESLFIPHRIALDFNAIKLLVLDSIGEDKDKTCIKLQALCKTLGLDNYGNAEGIWVRMRA